MKKNFFGPLHVNLTILWQKPVKTRQTNGKIWSFLDKIWTFLDKIWQKPDKTWQYLTKTWQNLTKPDKNLSKLDTITDNLCVLCVLSAKNDEKWSKMIKNDQKMMIFDQKWPKNDDFRSILTKSDTILSKKVEKKCQSWKKSDNLEKKSDNHVSILDRLLHA